MNDCKSTLQQHFLAQIQPTLHFRMLFEDLPNIIFFAKDRQGRLMMGNKLFVQHCGFQREEEIIGLTDYDIFPPELVEQYAADDLKIIESGQPKNNIVELFPNYLGDAHWFMTTKIPLFNQDHEIIGVCGTCQSYEESSNFVRPYLELSTAIDFLKNNFCKKILIDELACMVNLSTRQFERRFKDIFNTTVHQYILKLRILKSCDYLLKSDKSIAEIALTLGFYDQSTYTKYFKKHMTKTPFQYQKEKRQ